MLAIACLAVAFASLGSIGVRADRAGAPPTVDSGWTLRSISSSSDESSVGRPVVFAAKQVVRTQSQPRGIPFVAGPSTLSSVWPASSETSNTIIRSESSLSGRRTHLRIGVLLI